MLLFSINISVSCAVSFQDSKQMNIMGVYLNSRFRRMSQEYFKFKASMDILGETNNWQNIKV